MGSDKENFDKKEDIQPLSPQRAPEPGSAGETLSLYANAFQVNIDTLLKKSPKIFKYDLAIVSKHTNKEPRKELSRKILKYMQDQHGDAIGTPVLAFDGKKNVYTNKAIPMEGEKKKNFVVDFEGKSKFPVVFLCTLTTVSELDLVQEMSDHKQFSQDTLVALTIILSQRPILDDGFVSVKNQHFPLSERALSVGEGCEARNGYHQSCKMVETGLFVNLQLKTKVFYEGIPVVDFIRNILPSFDANRPFEDYERKLIDREIKFLEVNVTHRGDRSKVFKIKGLTVKSARQQFFSDRDGKEMSVADYFANTYGRLNFPNLQMLALNGKRDVFLPLEHCCLIPNQVRTKKIKDRMLSNMKNLACKNPIDLANDIRNFRRMAAYERDEFARHFGLEISEEMLKVKARVIEPPTVRYGKHSKEDKFKSPSGSWNLRDAQLYEAAPEIKNWAIVVLADNRKFGERNVGELIQGMVRAGKEKGLVVNSHPYVVPLEPRRVDFNSIEEILRDAKNSAGNECAIIMVVKDADSSYPLNRLYDRIKMICETKLGIPTQCILSSSKQTPQYYSNVLLKINLKTGGRNHVLDIGEQDIFQPLKGTFMVCGASVSNSTAFETNRPTIHSIVGSVDPQVVSYIGQVGYNGERITQIESMDHDFKNLLERFYAINDEFPKSIVMFRDGVSEGEMAKILEGDGEYRKIISACESLDSSYIPRITYIVVNKNHNMRFFATPESDTNFFDRKGNSTPGTIIDSGATHHTNWEFYLYSHSALQGTSRPARYTVLIDQNNFKQDEIQKFVYHLCFTYARCPKSVSVAPPAYYSDLLAQRQLGYLVDQDFELTSGASRSGRGGDRDETKPEINIEKLPLSKPNLINCMYYM